MADDALLSDLCGICNTAKFKYRCPGCAARTCSLPCYKRHQQWAQCDGKRDPTKFVKKSELATPAGIDHDFNFLTGIERGLEKAAKRVESTTSGTPTDVRQAAQTRRIADQRLAGTGVTIIRAPTGLSRQKHNKTHRSKKGNTIWTVEWIRDDQTRILNECSEVVPLLQSFPFKPETPAKKRKLNVDNPVEAPNPLAENEHSREPKDKKPRLPTSEQSGFTAEGNQDPDVANHDDPSLPLHVPNPEPLPPKYDFFLLRPRTSSSRRVLVPLDPQLPLSVCLRGRTVLEFPTIHIFPTTTPPPAEEFMLEDEYLHQEGLEQKELDEVLKHVSPETLRALQNENDTSEASGEQLDSNKILDVLKQDIGAARLGSA